MTRPEELQVPKTSSLATVLVCNCLLQVASTLTSYTQT